MRDTETGSAGEYLYASQGWIKFGNVPDYALRADGSRADPASFFTSCWDDRIDREALLASVRW